MNKTGNEDFAARERLVFDPRHPTFFFDFSAVMECHPSLRHPERMALMCEAEVRRAAPGELMVPDDKGFYLVVRSRRAADAGALAEEMNHALMLRLFGTGSPDAVAPFFRSVASSTVVELDVGSPVRPVPAPRASRPASPSPARPTAVVACGHTGFEPGFMPLFNLRGDGPPVYLCGASLQKDGRRLFGADALRFCHQQYRPSVDIAMLQFALAQMPVRMPTKFVSTIATGVSYETLAWSRSRQLYQDVLKAAGAAGRDGITIKIDDVPEGTPATRLKDMVGALKPFVKHVVVQLPEYEDTLMRSDRIGVSGISAAITPRMSAPDVIYLARWAGHVAAAQHGISWILGAGGASTFSTLRGIGVGFASSRPKEGVLPLGCLPREIVGASERRAA